MTDEDDAHDDGLVWGFMSGENFVPLPKRPFILAGLGPPPFDVVLPSEEIRHVIHKPCEAETRQVIENSSIDTSRSEA